MARFRIRFVEVLIRRRLELRAARKAARLRRLSAIEDARIMRLAQKITPTREELREMRARRNDPVLDNQAEKPA